MACLLLCSCVLGLRIVMDGTGVSVALMLRPMRHWFGFMGGAFLIFDLPLTTNDERSTKHQAPGTFRRKYFPTFHQRVATIPFPGLALSLVRRYFYGVSPSWLANQGLF